MIVQPAFIVSILVCAMGCGGAQTTCPSADAGAVAAIAPSGSSAPVPAKESAMPVDALQARAVQIVRDIYGPKADEVYATFGQSFRDAVPIDKYHEVNQSVVTRVGAFVDARFAEVLVPKSAAGHKFAVVGFFKDGADVHTLTFDDHDVLVGLLVKPIVVPAER
jgi:hypothetical protein